MILDAFTSHTQLEFPLFSVSPKGLLQIKSECLEMNLRNALEDLAVMHVKKQIFHCPLKLHWAEAAGAFGQCRCTPESVT